MLLSLKLQIWCLFQVRSSLTFRQTTECRFTLKLVHDIIITYSQIYLSIYISGSRFIRLSNAFFPDPEPATINTLYGQSEIPGQFDFFFFFHVFFCNIIEVNYLFVSLYYTVTFNLFFSLTRSFLVLYAYVFIKSVNCILLSCEHKSIFLISSVKTLCFSHYAVFIKF